MRKTIAKTGTGWSWLAGLLLGLVAMAGLTQLHAETPQVGAKAPDFSLATPEGKPVRLFKLIGRGDVVLIALRGYPGYQCPFCQKQVHDFVTHAKAFADRGVQVVFVYPGPGAKLDEHAKEFLSQEEALPANLHMVLDPDYAFTNLYGLRWDAPQETAYPSTFLIDRKGWVFWEKVVKSHGDRTTAEQVLAELGKSR